MIPAIEAGLLPESLFGAAWRAAAQREGHCGGREITQSPYRALDVETVLDRLGGQWLAGRDARRECGLSEWRFRLAIRLAVESGDVEERPIPKTRSMAYRLAVKATA